MENLDGIQDASRFTGRDVGALGKLGTDCHEDGVETFFKCIVDIIYASVELEDDSHIFDAIDFGI